MHIHDMSCNYKPINAPHIFYSSVDDVDLYPAAVSERVVSGGTVGPTFSCILGRQFRNSKVGDRFWYERGDRVVGFTQGRQCSILTADLTSIHILCSEFLSKREWWTVTV